MSKKKVEKTRLVRLPDSGTVPKYMIQEYTWWSGWSNYSGSFIALTDEAAIGFYEDWKKRDEIKIIKED